MEKPSHNNFNDAAEFYESINRDRSILNRLLIGFHDSLHPSRRVLRETIKKKSEEVGMKEIHITFNFPKDPNDP